MSSANRVLPGFGLSLGYTLAYLSLIVLVPLSAVFLKTATMDFDRFWSAVASDRVVASFKLSFGMALAAAAINVIFGLLLAWAIVRYSFPGRKIIDSLVDLPFALPTAVAGIRRRLSCRTDRECPGARWWQGLLRGRGRDRGVEPPCAVERAAGPADKPAHEIVP